MDPRWRALFEASPFFVLVIDRAGKILEINRTVEPYTREEVIGRDAFEFMPAEDVAGARARCERVLATGLAEESTSRTTEGHFFTVRAVPVTRDGRVEEIVLVTTDDSEARRAHEELERREKLFRALVDMSSDGFALSDGQGNVSFASPSTARILGLPDGTRVGDPFALMHPEDRERMRAMRRELAEARGPVRTRLRIVRPDGDVRTLDVVCSNHLGDPAVSGIVSNYRDVTDQERAERERDRFFDLSLDLMAVVTPEGRFRRLSQGWETTLGWTLEEIAARPYVELIHPEDREATLSMQDETVAGTPVNSFENRYLCRDGSYRWLQWKATFDPQTQLVYAIARDVTAKKERDEKRLQSQKMEAIGRLASGVAHDVNNMLAVIYASIESLRDLVDGDAAHAELEEIQYVAERSAGLVRQLLAFGRKQSRSVRPVEIDHTVATVAKMVGRLIGEDVRVETRLGGVGRIAADDVQIETALMNLALNARDAMPSGGTITIATAERWIDAAAAPALGVAAGRYVELSVADEGCGIPKSLRDKIFEPFFTTKSVGKGTGLGLATVFGMVRQSGGTIEVESEVGVGSTFRVLLPFVAAEARQPSSAAGAPSMKGQVLVVEDDELTRSSIARMLARDGWGVLEAKNGAEALSLIQTPARIDVVLSDVVMPGRDGVVVAEEVRRTRPRARVVLMSGFGDHPALSRARTDVMFVRKPFTAAELASALRQAS